MSGGGGRSRAAPQRRGAGRAPQPPILVPLHVRPPGRCLPLRGCPRTVSLWRSHTAGPQPDGTTQGHREQGQCSPRPPDQGVLTAAQELTPVTAAHGVLPAPNPAAPLPAGEDGPTQTPSCDSVSRHKPGVRSRALPAPAARLAGSCHRAPQGAGVATPPGVVCSERAQCRAGPPAPPVRARVGLAPGARPRHADRPQVHAHLLPRWARPRRCEPRPQRQ